MDTTNVNSGEKNGLKRHFEHKVSLLKWIGCNHHKLALTFKHLIPSFQCVAEINIFLLNLWKFFQYRPLPMNISGNTSEMYDDSPAVPICPSVTWWQAHERACAPPFWKFPWCTLKIISETKGSRSATGCSFKAHLVKPLQQIWCSLMFSNL